MPAPLVKLGAGIDRMIRREKARLTPDRASYFCHPDWSSRIAAGTAGIGLDAFDRHPEIGLAATAQAYRERGFLR